jgi:hypothetical protein
MNDFLAAAATRSREEGNIYLFCFARVIFQVSAHRLKLQDLNALALQERLVADFAAEQGLCDR